MKISLLASSIFLFPLAAHSAEFSGFAITYETLPSEARELIPITITSDQFTARLNEGGTIILDGNITTIGQLDNNNKSLAFIALDRLELRNGAKIITNGNNLVVFVNTLVSDDGEIVSFPEDAPGASNGTPGNSLSEAGGPGAPGSSGGVVSIHVINAIEGQLDINLRGQNGGIGGSGAQGGQGTPGSRGVDAKDGPLGLLGVGWCERGGGNGSAGGKGFPGGAGGSGGPGGDGGFFQLVNVGPAPLPEASFEFSATGGQPGANGPGGPGGPPGSPGDGGNGSAYCTGGQGGPEGEIGDPGTTLPNPSRTGAEGNYITKNLDLEVAIRSAVIASPINQ